MNDAVGKMLNTYTVIDYVPSLHGHNRERNSLLTINTFIEDGTVDCRARHNTVDVMCGMLLRAYDNYGIKDEYKEFIRRHLDDDYLNVLINGVSLYESGFCCNDVGDYIRSVIEELTNEAIELSIEKHKKYLIKQEESQQAEAERRLNFERQRELKTLSELQAKYGAGAGE